MFEVLIVVIGLFIILAIDSFWLSLAVLFIIIILISPGIYSMIFGAPFTITNNKRLKAMFELANFKKTDKVYDLGCGNGKVIQKIAPYVEEAIGYEFSIPTYLYALLIKFLIKSKTKIYFRNFWKQDYSDADVLICFLLPFSMQNIEKIIWPKLKKGTRLISNDSKFEKIKSDKNIGQVFLYIKK